MQEASDIKPFFSFFSFFKAGILLLTMRLHKRIGIDLGTANSLVWVTGQGIVLNEPTVVAVSLSDKTVLAVGNEARRMLGRTPENIVASRPMRDGVIADYVVTEAMLRYFIRKVMGRAYLVKPEVMICVSSGSTQVERRAVMDATYQAGARKVYLIEEPVAAAIGAGLPIGEASGNMIVDIGGGATEAAVISLGGVVVYKSQRVGGTKLDEAIANFIKRKHNLVIGDQTAEKIKIEIGDAMESSENSENSDSQKVGKSDSQMVKRSNFPPSGSPTLRLSGSTSIPSVLNSLQVKGRNSISGLPRIVTVTSAEVTESIQPILIQIVKAIKSVLEAIPPELSSDIIDRGIVLSGGSSLLKNFPKFVTKETGVPSFVAEDAILCVIKGTGIALDNLDDYMRSVTVK